MQDYVTKIEYGNQNIGAAEEIDCFLMQSLQVDKGAMTHVTRWRVLGRNIPTRKGALPHAAAEPTCCIAFG